MTDRSVRTVAVRAVLEMTVIIVGVLAALGVDEWRQAVADADLGREYALRLIDDLATTAAGLVLADSYQAQWIEAGRETLQHLTGEEVLPAERLLFSSYMVSVRAVGRTPFLGSRSTYDELIATGALQILDDAELRAKLADYYTNWEIVGTLVENTPAEYWDWYRGVLSPTALEGLLACQSGFDTPGCTLELGPYDASRFRRLLAGDRDEVESALNRLVQHYERSSSRFADLAASTDSLTTALRNYGHE